MVDYLADAGACIVGRALMVLAHHAAAANISVCSKAGKALPLRRSAIAKLTWRGHAELPMALSAARVSIIAVAQPGSKPIIH